MTTYNIKDTIEINSHNSVDVQEFSFLLNKIYTNFAKELMNTKFEIQDVHLDLIDQHTYFLIEKLKNNEILPNLLSSHHRKIIFDEFNGFDNFPISRAENKYKSKLPNEAILKFLGDRKCIKGQLFEYHSYDIQEFAELNIPQNQRFDRIDTKKDFTENIYQNALITKNTNYTQKRIDTGELFFKHEDKIFQYLGESLTVKPKIVSVNQIEGTGKKFLEDLIQINQY